MKSRPKTRHPYDVALQQQAIRLLDERGVQARVYGQDAPGGFLDEDAKRARLQSCSCYLSFLPPWAGFGLAQHECMAAGVPVAGLSWGDIHDDASVKLLTLASTVQEGCEIAVRLCRDPAFARSASSAALEYIANELSPGKLDDSVERFVTEVGGRC